MKPKVAVVIGHHPNAPGAALRSGQHTIHERAFWKPFGRELVRSFLGEGMMGRLVERPNEKPDEELAQRVNETEADVAIELHFNAFKDPAAEGSEMLYYRDSEDGRDLADYLLLKTTNALDTRTRGLVPKTNYPFLFLTKMPAVICEPAFGSNIEDAWKLITRQPDLLRAYREALKLYFNKKDLLP